MKGYVQVYTGDGKGKTTAAMGLALRAAGAGLKVRFIQYVKGMEYSETKALERFADLIETSQHGRECFINRNPAQEDTDVAREGLDVARAALSSGDYQVVILDEANIAMYYDLFTVEELLDAIAGRDVGCEVVVTGRKAPDALIAAADLVTEMREIKHYYTGGVHARTGIER